jgi:hypothetical protein
MTYYAAQPMPMAGMGSGLTEIVKAPISRWNQSSTMHKILSAGAGAGLAYYLHQKGMADAAVAVAGIAGAYATSMALHYPAVAQQPALVSQPVANGLLPAANGAPPANQAQQPLSAAPSIPPPAAGSKWAMLG